MAKWFTGNGRACHRRSLQLHGGYGFIGDHPIERFYRDAKIVEIYEGTKEIEKIIIAGHFWGDIEDEVGYLGPRSERFLKL